MDIKIKNKLVENLKEWKICYLEDINYYIEKIKNSKNVNEILLNKQKLLIDFLNNVPLTSDECYFCIKTDCPDCLYGKFHGICDKNNSTYDKINNKFIELIEEIKKYYNPEINYDE